MPEIELTGCAPEPLLSYLKALGIFRLVAEQADPAARLSWRGSRCRLDTAFDRDGLVAFFRDRYSPTPITGPWGARSGFYPGSSESSARHALDRIVAGSADRPRLGRFRDAVVAIRALLEEYGYAAKADGDDEKLRLMRLCRDELADDLGDWLDAVYVLTADSRKFPPLLGTGGNEGSGSYVSTFAQAVVSLLIDKESDGGVPTSLFADATGMLRRMAVGHFDPGALGGPNSSQGFDGGGGVNPWDYLLGIEGSLLLAGKAARRLGSDSEGRAGYPFCVEAVAVGYGSASDKEEGAGTRAELWLPLWSQPATVGELRHFFGEGRAQLGRRQARNSVEFALALATLGVSKGVDAFVRYSFVMRNGLSYFAAPLGRVRVTPRPDARLLDDPPLAEWIRRLRAASRDKDRTPARYRTALREIDRAMFSFAHRSGLGTAADRAAADRTALADVLPAIGRAGRTLAGGLRFCDDNAILPLQGLDPQWLDRADDSLEFRLAASLAGVQEDKGVGPLREYVEPLRRNKFGRFEWDEGSTSAVWSNRPVEANLAAVFRRRQLESFRAGGEGVPLRCKRPARLADVLAFLRCETDDDKLADLLWALGSVHWRSRTVGRVNSDSARPAVPFEFAAPRLLVGPLPVTFDRGLGRWRRRRGGDAASPEADPEVFHALGTGRPDAVGECVDRAARRLRSGGLTVRGYRNRARAGRPLGVTSPFDADRLLAALLFPLSLRDLSVVAAAALAPPDDEAGTTL